MCATTNDPTPTTPVEALFSVAAREVDEAWLADWLRKRITFGI